MLARRRIRHPPSLQVHSGPSCSRQGTPAPGEGIPARMEQDQPTGAAVGKKSSTQGDVRSSGQGPKTFLIWGGGGCTAEPCRAHVARIRSHTPAPKHPGRLAFHFYTFSLCFGLFCNLFLDMTKPLQRTYASRQRADTRFSPLSWTHPIRAEAGFGIFRGGGWRCCNPSIQPEGH